MKCQFSRNVINQVLRGDANSAKISIRDISWYVLQYTIKLHHQMFLGELINSRAQAELSYIARSVPVKNVVSQKNWSLDSGIKGKIDIPIYNIVPFQSGIRLDAAPQDESAVF